MLEKRKKSKLTSVVVKLFIVMFIILLSYANDNIKAISDDITIGQNPYSSLQEAIDAAEDNDIIMINADIEEENIINVNTGMNFSIDLNGNTIEMTKEMKITNDSNLQIRDSSSETIGKITTLDDPMFRIEAGKLTLASGTYHSKGGEWAWGVLLIGSTNSNDKDYSVVDVKEGATITFETNGYGIATTPTQSKDKKFGMVANIEGTIIADGSKAGSSVYINGNQKDLTGEVTKINISESAKL